MSIPRVGTLSVAILLPGLHLLRHASNFLFHCLNAVRARAEPEIRADARRPERVQRLVAALNRAEDLVPLAFHVRAVGVQRGLQSRTREDLLALRDIRRQRQPDAE